MYFSQTYKTKWHDTDGDGVMRPSALLVYMQETANLQCREYGMDLNDLHHKEGKGFLLSRMMVKVFTPLCAYEDIEVRTWCVDAKGYNFIRCFSVHRGGEMTALAVSHWALLDIRDGKMLRTAEARVLRDGQVVFDGKMSTLRRFQDEVEEVKSGLECGIRLADYNDYEEGDIIECYTLEKIKQTL